jgi:perosamine synthetase
MRIPLSAPDIDEADIEAVVRVLRTPRLSLGPKMEEFERAVSQYIGVPHGVAVASGTAGLHLALRALGIGEGDEVILPSFTYIATAHAVLYERAVPVFVDIDPATFNLNPELAARAITPRTRAVIVVHTFGRPADMHPILDLAARHGLRVIEDGCEALGAEYHGKKQADSATWASSPSILISPSLPAKAE